MIYCTLFFRLLAKYDFPAMKFTLYFMGFENKDEIPKDEKERNKWVFSRKATIELTQYVSCRKKHYTIINLFQQQTLMLTKANSMKPKLIGYFRFYVVSYSVSLPCKERLENE